MLSIDSEIKSPLKEFAILLKIRILRYTLEGCVKMCDEEKRNSSTENSRIARNTIANINKQYHIELYLKLQKFRTICICL